MKNNCTYQLGLIAVGKRKLKDGSQYDYLFPTPDFKQTELVGNATHIDETIFKIAEYIKKYQADTAQIAPKLKGKTVFETCKNIFDFVFNHIQYKLDDAGLEQLRRPARSWFERETGVDCDCYTIFIVTVLINIGIAPILRVTKYDGKEQFQHIYPIIPTKNGYLTIDCVLSEFNYEKTYSFKKDYTMTQLGIPVIGLHGLTENNESNNLIKDLILNGMGSLNGPSPENDAYIYKKLIQTRDWAIKNPTAINSNDYAPGFIKMLDYAIVNFSNKNNREKAFEVLAMNEAQLNKAMGITASDLSGNEDEDDYLNGLTESDTFEGIDEDEIYAFDGLGKPKKSQGKDGKAGRIEARKENQKIRQEKRAIRKYEKKEERQENKAFRKDERKEAKGFFRKIGVSLKQGGKSFIKLNPAVIASRNGFLLALRLNLLKLSKRLRPAYSLNAAEAKVSDSFYRASKDALAKTEAIFIEKLGGSKISLKNAILSNPNLNGICGLGLDPTTDALIIAALPTITAIAVTVGKSFENAEEETDIYDDIEESHEETLEGLGKIQKGNKKALRKEARQQRRAGKKAARTDGEKTGIISKIKGIIENKKILNKKASEQPDALNKVLNDPENITEESTVNDVTTNTNTTNNIDTPPKEGSSNFLTSIVDMAKANPIPTLIILAGGTYAFVPPVRNAINNMIGVGKKSTSATPELKGLQTYNMNKKLKVITLK